MMSAYFVVLNETEKKQVNGNIGQLKGLITDQYLNINQKGKDTCQVLSYHRFLNITNRQDA
jgi:phage/plasmid-associated DNA primase